MTMEEINKLFPPEYGGPAQISDLRLALTYLNNYGELGGIEFHEVQTIADMQALDADQGDVCKVANDGSGQPQTYIYDNTQWKILVEPRTSGGTQYTKTTEVFEIDSTDEAFQEIALNQTPTKFDHIFVILNGIILTEGSIYDFELVGNMIYFKDNHLTAGDLLAVKYSY